MIQPASVLLFTGTELFPVWRVGQARETVLPDVLCTSSADKFGTS